MTMTDTEAKALALVKDLRMSMTLGGKLSRPFLQITADAADYIEATEARHAAELRELKERFDAFRQEVSDAIESCMLGPIAEERLTPFILPAPDPLVEAWVEATGNTVGMGPLNEALAKRGGKIVWEAGE